MTILFSCLLLLVIFYHGVMTLIQKPNRFEFDKLVDQDNFVVLLICSAPTDHSCIREREKLDLLSQQLTEYPDVIFGTIDKETDHIMVARCDPPLLPMVKLFPYNGQMQNYVLTIHVVDLKTHILDIRDQYLEDDESEYPEESSSRISLTEIDWIDMTTTVKDPRRSAILVVYDDDCVDTCRTMERVAKVFKDEQEVGFYKLSLDNIGPLRQTISFLKDPTILWYSKTEKQGFTYTSKVTLEALVEFINDNAALSRDYDGKLKANAGRIKEVDQIIEEHIILILTRHNIDYVIFLVDQLGNKLHHPKKCIQYYLALLKEMKKVEEPDLVILREQNFLNKMLSQSDGNTQNSDTWTKFLNILSGFVEYATNRLGEGTDSHVSSDGKKGRTKTGERKEVRHKAQLKPDIKWKKVWKSKLKREEL